MRLAIVLSGVALAAVALCYPVRVEDDATRQQSVALLATAVDVAFAVLSSAVLYTTTYLRRRQVLLLTVWSVASIGAVIRFVAWPPILAPVTVLALDGCLVVDLLAGIVMTLHD